MSPTLIALNILWIGAILAYVWWTWRKEESADRAARTPEAKARAKLRLSYARQYRPLPDDPRFPTADRDGVELLDVAQLATETPPTRPLPGLSAKRRLKPGARVKVWSMYEEGGAPEPADVLAALPEDRFTLKLSRGAEVTAHTNHIAEILPKARMH